VGLIIGLVLLTGCAQTQEQKLVKSSLDVFFQVIEEIDQGDKHYMDGCDGYARARTREERNTVCKHLTKAKQYYNTATQTLRKIPLQENEQIDEICSLLLQGIRGTIDSVSTMHYAVDQLSKEPPSTPSRELNEIKRARIKMHSADTKIIEAWNKIREFIGDKEENKEQYFPLNIVQYIDTVKERVRTYRKPYLNYE